MPLFIAQFVFLMTNTALIGGVCVDAETGDEEVFTVNPFKGEWKVER